MADPIRCVYAMEDGYFCTKHSDGFYDGSCRLLEGKPCEDQKPPKPLTNADRIRAMTDDELAELLWDVWKHKRPFYQECVGGWLVPFYHWLQKEADT